MRENLTERGVSFHKDAGSLDFPPVCEVELKGGVIIIAARLLGIRVKKFPPVQLSSLESASIQRRKNSPYVVLKQKQSNSELAFSTEIPKQWIKALQESGVKIADVFEEHPAIKFGVATFKLLFVSALLAFAVLMMAAIYFFSIRGK